MKDALVCLAAIGLLATCVGCNVRFWTSHLTSFSLGWILRDLTMPFETETVCFRNGVQIDCSEINWQAPDDSASQGP